MICEAAADSYLPLLWEFRALIRDGISPNVTFGITPTVMEQLSDERFHHWFLDYLGFRVNTATWDQEEWQRLGEGHLQHLAWRWQEHFTAMRRFYEEDLKGDILGAFRELDEQGHIEVTGSAATHGYFPLLREDTSILAQIRQGVATFQRFMGRRPRGFWLPECAYRPRSEWGEAPAIRGGSDLVFRPGVEELLANTASSSSSSITTCSTAATTPCLWTSPRVPGSRGAGCSSGSAGAPSITRDVGRSPPTPRTSSAMHSRITHRS